jgi:hypothetical protein
MALPALSFRERLAELSGSLAMSAVFALVTTTILAALPLNTDRTALFELFFLTVGVSWAILIPTRIWGRGGNEWLRRLALAAGGVVVGGLALYLDGWTGQALGISGEHTANDNPVQTLALATGAGFISYFGLSLGLLRWWKAADRRRSSRFSFFPVLAAGVWALLLLLVWPSMDSAYVGVSSLVMSSMIVQWVSPWEAPPPPAPRRLKLRRA